MLGIYVTVPIACFRKGQAREYLETEILPPPSTCYGFLLSLVGETDRSRHLGCRVTAGTIGESDISVVLRTVWRVKNRPLGSSGNTRPDYQQLLTDVRLIIWLDSAQEHAESGGLEGRVRQALTSPTDICRFGGLSLGESTHIVNDVCLLDAVQERLDLTDGLRVFLKDERGRLTLPVWVDHVGSSQTIHVTGDLLTLDGSAPSVDRIPQILNTVQKHK